MGARDELKVCGLAAVRARFRRDADSIQRLYFDEPTARKIGVICRALAAKRRVYRQLDGAELEKVAGTVHHGGIVAVVPAIELHEPSAADLRRWAKARDAVLVLDRIGNAHNLGAIARTAAFFGVAHLVLPRDPQAAVPNEAAYRVAEGGLEDLSVWRVSSLPAWLRQLRGVGYDVIGAATRGGGLGERGDAPPALVLGNEEHGLAPEVSSACTRLVTLQGRGTVESLNVSVAAGILLHAFLGPSRR